MPGEIKRSVCPYDCPDTCGLLVEVSAGKATKVSGDPEHPFTRGALCPKMNHYEKTVHSPLRLTTPLLRVGSKGSGKFQKISWAEAIQQISRRWQAIIREYGAEAILPYSYAGTMGLIQRNSGHPFFHRMGASRLERTICTPTLKIAWNMVLGNTPAPHPDEVMESDLIILWGINALATNIHFLHGVRKAKERGASIWLIDTYETPTAGLADRVFLVRPASDGALALGLMNLLVRENLIDHQFVSSCVQGFAELRDRVLPDYTPEKVSQITGLSLETLEFMARDYGKARSPFIRLGAGLFRYGNGAMNGRSILCLPALVGAYGKKGAGLFNMLFTSDAISVREVQRADFLPRKTRTLNMNKLGSILNQTSDPPIKSLYVYHSNPAAVTPDQNQVLKGLAREDLFTVVHERFLTDTASFADIVLPATSSLEHSDLYLSYGHYCIQRAKAAIPTVGESKPNWEVFGLLAEAMGFPETFFRQSADQLIDHLLSIPHPLRNGIDTQALAEGKPALLNFDSDRFSHFHTPSKKIEILNPAENPPLPCYLPPHGGEEPFRLMTAPSAYALNSSFRERGDLLQKEKEMFLKMNSEDAKSKGLTNGQKVVAFNNLGEVPFVLQVTPKIPRGVAVAEGVWWLENCPGPRSVNSLTSQRLTDKGAGSTFYDNTVDVRRES